MRTLRLNSIALAGLVAAAATVSSLPPPELSLGQGQPGERGERPPEGFRAEELFPPRERSMVFLFIEGGNEGDSIAVTLRRDQDDVWVRETDGHRVEYLRLSGDGDVVLLGEELPSEGYSFRYDPAPVVIPAVVRPGLEQQKTGQVHIYDLNNDGRRQRTTEYEHTLRVRGMRLVPGPGGERMRAVVIRTERAADLGEAQVETAIEKAYYPGSGRIYERTETKVRGGPFNLWSETTVHTLRYSEENRRGHQRR